MSEIIFTAAALMIGALICGAGLYYLSREKDDPESRKIYSITAGVGTVIVIGTIIKILVIGF